MLYKSDRPSEEAADKKYLTPMLIFHSHICYPAYIFSELTSVCFSTVESGVWLSMESPHRQVFSVGGIHLRIPGVWNPCRLVRVLFLHDSRRSSHIGGVKKKKKCLPYSFFIYFFLRFGRHPVLIISVLFMLVFGLTVAFSVNVPMFSTLRFFEGFCLAGITLSLYVLSKCLSVL